ncbi:hypothetical protein GKQ23_12970 [Erwinia sp. E602]|uniref:hypothetical protein n=1 Tax=Erwinia sp. E602 TaxID=2675378 RepID=UPI001BA5BA03|nr:hypothetical protein [Erwinia sp. E602]QUG75851.1 hypothetical protein GKQ23_12970 [Erwinia sp. E602]
MNNTFEQHYEEQTPYIALDGITPTANSVPLTTSFLSKKLRKQISKESIQCDNYMNVIFEKKQTFEKVLKWTLRELELDVVLLEEKQLFVRGKPFWAYCVVIIC